MAATFVTPNQYQLNALWFGPEKPSKGYIFIHGLSSSAFSHHEILTPLVNGQTMALYFNNRGHDDVGGVRKLLPETKKGYETQSIGAAHEVFTDCVDDVQGAIDFLKDAGIKDIYLVGHSTGCQKSIYYLSQTTEKINGVILLCPMSDYAYMVASESPDKIRKATEYAQKLVDDSESHKLLPQNIWEELLDAQRFLSLYTPNSVEEIFSYSQPDIVPTTFRKVTTPILAVLAESDEYADRAAADIIKWLKKETKTNIEAVIVEDSGHNLVGHEDEVANLIKTWVEGLSLN
ncbi:MAG TPA: alpha/beta fold hydrolase [Candidatus Binatia bacterium]|nr:alpha/beta fold hydrolase [Candidatus Binatia bacterium]